MALRFVVTLANSIIGVSILAMPFCFKKVFTSALLGSVVVVSV
jgi:amino acid permease